MINDALSVGLSGVKNAQTALANSANNVANQFSTSQITPQGVINTPFTPKDVVSISTNPGVQSQITQRNIAPIGTFKLDSALADAEGIVQLPNVDVVTETADQLLAKNSFLFNLKTIQTADETLGSLLDATS